jgi:undecaprenyl-diphosphatase
MIVGMIASGITGYFAIAFLLRFVRSRSYDLFVGYRLIAAVGVLLIIGSGLRAATF